MANPSYTYNLSGSPLTGITVVLPRGPVWGRVKGKDETNITHTTNRGVMWVYRLMEREVREYLFRFPESEYAAFRALHDNVKGQLTAFNWNYEGTTLLVRKEAGFRPEPFTDEPYRDTAGTLAHWYNYKLILTAESSGLAILA